MFKSTDVLPIKAPFWGLNDVADRLTDSRYARVATNVFLHEDVLRPRDGFSILTYFGEESTQVTSLDCIQQMFYSTIVYETTTVPVLFFIMDTGAVGYMFYNGGWITPTTSHNALPSFNEGVINSTIGRWNVNAALGRIVFCSKKANKTYICPQPTGWAPRITSSGLNGAIASAYGELVDTNNTLALQQGKYHFAYTVYDSVTGTESNYKKLEVGGFPDDALVDILGDKALRVTVSNAFPKRVSHMRLYAQIDELQNDPNAVEAGGEDDTIYRLIGEGVVYRGSLQVTFNDRNTPIIGEGALSTRSSGPFAPTLNGNPPASTCSATYENITFYAGKDGKLYYSEPGNPEHVSPLDFLVLPSSLSTEISYMLEYKGRLIIFTQGEIFVLAGLVSRRSNAEAALGLPSPTPQFQLFKSESVHSGCINVYGGVGAIECDDILYYSASDGIYAFDGLRSIKVSEDIQSTFDAIPFAYKQQCILANDANTGLLWACYPSNSFTGETTTLLCYDYRFKNPETGFGRWTKHTIANLTSIAPASPFLQSLTYADKADSILLGGGVRLSSENLYRTALGAIRPNTIYDFKTEGDSNITWEYETPDINFGTDDYDKNVQSVKVSCSTNMTGSNFIYITFRTDIDAYGVPKFEKLLTVYLNRGQVQGYHSEHTMPANMRCTSLRLRLTGSSIAYFSVLSFSIKFKPTGWR